MGRYGILALLSIGVALIILIQPSVGASILAITIFSNISDLLTNRGYTGFLKPLVVLVFGAILIRNIYVRQIPLDRPRLSQIETFLLSFFVIMAASFFVATDKSKASRTIIDMGKDILIIYCFLFSVRNFSVWKGIVWVVILTTCGLCLLGLYQEVTGNYSQTFFGLASVQNEKVFSASLTPRQSGPINAPNMWGQILIAVMPLVLYRVLHEKNRWTKLLAIGISGIVLVAILNTYSRGAYLGLFVVIALIVIEKRPNLMGLIASMGLVIIVIMNLPPTYVERFQSLSFLTPGSENGIYQDASFRGRGSEMLTGLYMFEFHPLLGVGAGNYSTNYLKFAQLVGLEFRAEQREPHSLYIQFLAETGILGLTAFIGVLYFLFIALNRAKKLISHSPRDLYLLPWVNSIQVSITGYLTASFFLHGAYIRYFWILVALAITAIQLTDEIQIGTDKIEVVQPPI